MALDTIPSVIIYKGNVDTIADVSKMFAAEYAAITILPDGIPPTLPIHKKYRDFSNISPEIQKLVNNAPDNLWLGEAIHRIAPASFLDENGALVISSHAVYFIDKPAGDTHCRWLIIPYSRINDSIIINERDSLLTISYQDSLGQQNDVFALPSEALVSLQKSIEQAMAAKRYLIKIKSLCPSCNQVSQNILEHISSDSHCSGCGQSIQRTIVL
jgi:hypothetical protein